MPRRGSGDAASAAAALSSSSTLSSSQPPQLPQLPAPHHAEAGAGASTRAGAGANDDDDDEDDEDEDDDSASGASGSSLAHGGFARRRRGARAPVPAPMLVTPPRKAQPDHGGAAGVGGVGGGCSPAHGPGAACSSPLAPLSPGTSAAALAAAAAAAPKRWADWWLRLGMTLVMISSCFAYVFIFKQPGVVLLIFVLQSFIYRELVALAVKDSKEKAMPGFKAFYYYWFFVLAFFIYLKTFKNYLLSQLRGVPVADIGLDVVEEASEGERSGVGARRGAARLGSALLALFTGGSGGSSWGGRGVGGVGEGVGAGGGGGGAVDSGGGDGGGVGEQPARHLFIACLDWLVSHHEPVAYVLYVLGFIAFVISLRQRRNFRYQFSQFAYCHMALLLVVVQSTYLAANVYNGIIWFFVPCGLVVCNDSMAYVSGFFFGRTPLIRLSPKKTVEGFVGGAIATVLFAIVSTHFYTTLPYFGIKFIMACPVVQGVGWQPLTCDVDAQAGGLYRAFPMAHWRVGRLLVPEVLRERLWASEMQLHAVAFALFASVVAPFGGFFASGFKRAFKIKDFGAAIPGHGGFTDRMDCQLVMGSFSYIYCVYNMHLGETGSSLVQHYRQMLIDRLGEADLRDLQQQLQRHLEAATAQRN